MIRNWFIKGKKKSELSQLSDSSNAGWSELIHHLRDLGMWDDVDSGELESGFDSMIAEQNIWLVDSPRFLMADSEEFAEGGIGEWLDEYQETHAKHGFTFQSHEDRCEEDGYVFILDGTEHTVYTQQQLQRHGQDCNIEELATGFAKSAQRPVPIQRRRDPRLPVLRRQRQRDRIAHGAYCRCDDL